MKIKGSLQVSIVIVKAFLSRFLVQNVAESRDLWTGGRLAVTHIWISRPRFAYTLYNFHDDTTKIKGSLLMSIPVVKRVWPKIFQVYFWAKISTFLGETEFKCWF